MRYLNARSHDVTKAQYEEALPTAKSFTLMSIWFNVIMTLLASAYVLSTFRIVDMNLLLLIIPFVLLAWIRSFMMSKAQKEVAAKSENKLRIPVFWTLIYEVFLCLILLIVTIVSAI